jgi:hypothetical protein
MPHLVHGQMMLQPNSPHFVDLKVGALTGDLKVGALKGDFVGILVTDVDLTGDLVVTTIAGASTGELMGAAVGRMLGRPVGPFKPRGALLGALADCGALVGCFDGGFVGEFVGAFVGGDGSTHALVAFGVPKAPVGPP